MLHVQFVGLAIYIFSLAFVISCTTRNLRNISGNQPDIATVFPINDTAEGGDQESKEPNKFGLNFVGEEDDDDSAKNYYWDPVSNIEFIASSAANPIIGFLSNPRNVNTPPPWC